MSVYADLYEFAARAGAFEGYVYRRESLDPSSLVPWVDHLVRGYRRLPPEVRAEFQPLCDGTIGRAIQSLRAAVGEGDELIPKLGELVSGQIPSSADDFRREKGETP